MSGAPYRFKSSISFKIITLLVVCLTSVITISSVYSYIIKRQELLRERDQHSVQSVERLALTVATPLWNFDLEQLEKLISAEIKSETSIGILVWTPDGRLLIEKTNRKHDQGNWSSSDSLPTYQGQTPSGIHVVSKEVRRDQQLLGTIQIVYDNQHIEQTLNLLTVNELIKAVILVATTCLVLYLGLARVLLKQLKTICITAQEFSDNNLAKRIQVYTDDEIGVLSKILNHMADRIGEKIKQLESALDEVNQLQANLDDIINSMPSIIIVVNQQSEVILWNSRAEELTGIPFSAACGKQVGKLLPQFAIFFNRIDDMLHWDTTYQTDKQTVQTDGRSCRYSLQMFPLSSGHQQQLVVRIDDITEHARIEELMIQNEKMTMVGGLAAGMAHEINNPLATILQNSQNIERRISLSLPANKETAEVTGVNLEKVADYLEKRGIPVFLTQIREAGARIAKIINTMLRFTNKSASGKESADLKKLLEQTLELAASDYDMKKLYDFNKIVIHKEFDPSTPHVQVIVSEIEHVLLNLLKNAAQAAASVKNDRIPQITLRIRSRGQMSVIDIEDNGPGMKESIQRHIYEPFYSTREVGEGTGLGLSIAHAIITNNYKGWIEFESITGKGTCFSISIPSSGVTSE